MMPPLPPGIPGTPAVPAQQPTLEGMGLKLGMPDEIMSPQDWLTYPDWLYKSDNPVVMLYTSREALEQGYIRFAGLSNSHLQTVTFLSLKKLIDHVGEKYKDQETLESRQNYRNGVLEAYFRWLVGTSHVLDKVGVTGVFLYVDVFPDKPSEVKLSKTLSDMSSGVLPFNFLDHADHAEVRRQFMIFSMELAAAQSGCSPVVVGKLEDMPK